MIIEANSSRLWKRNPVRSSLQKNAGVGIIEVLIASVILVIALMGFLSVAVSTTNLGGKNARTATANALIYDKYEELKSIDFSTIVNSSELDIGVDANGNLVQGIFDRTVVVTALPDGTSTTIAANIAITVSWLGRTMTQTSIFMAD